MKCPFCRHEIADDTKKCPKCFAAIPTMEKPKTTDKKKEKQEVK